MSRPYTDDEIEILINNYPSMDWNELLKLLPGRNKASIIKKANKMGIVRNSNATDIEKVKDLIKDKPYSMIDETFSTMSNGFAAITDDGYKVFITFDNIYRDREPRIFYKGNPYTIENIHKYIEKNKIDIELLSTEYQSNTDPLIWKCQCGNIFHMTWMAFYAGKHTCNFCAAKNYKQKNNDDYEYVKNAISDDGYNILHIDESIPLYKQKIDVEDRDGYRYSFRWSDYNNGKHPAKFGRGNPFTIYNINKLLELTDRSDYVCISEFEEYKNNTSILNFMHIPCGTIFQSNLTAMQGKVTKSKTHRYYKQCPNCQNKMIESVHASVLKQVFIHEYPDTILEDRSCINPETGRALPTDIVNHRKKIAIEIQSQYHDSEWRIERDKFKKNFWLNKGYLFYDPDIRDYSIIQLIQMFFPYIKEVPDYVDYNFSNCYDFTIIQKYFDEGYTATDISKMTGIKHSTILGMVHNNKIILPDNYKEDALNIKSIVRLDLDGNYMETFPILSSVKEVGCNPSMVSKVLKGKRFTHHSSYWVYEKDYLSDNYKLPDANSYITN